MNFKKWVNSERVKSKAKFKKQKSSSEKIQNAVLTDQTHSGEENYSLTNSERKVSKTELKQKRK